VEWQDQRNAACEATRVVRTPGTKASAASENSRTQNGDPKPLLEGRFSLLLIAPVMSFRHLLKMWNPGSVELFQGVRRSSPNQPKKGGPYCRRRCLTHPHYLTRPLRSRESHNRASACEFECWSFRYRRQSLSRRHSRWRRADLRMCKSS